jgi:hypothetical protein
VVEDIEEREADGELIWNSGTQEGNSEGFHKKNFTSVFPILGVPSVAIDLAGNLSLFS